MKERGKVTVLHVAESWGGGVQTAVLDYVRSVPEVQHALLMADRAGCRISSSAEESFSHVWHLPAGHAARVNVVTRCVRELRPERVHAHSSLAGVYVRLSAVPTARIIYTPHCYAMERTDLRRHSLAAVKFVERLLARRTSVVAGVSPREVMLARQLRNGQKAFYVPNIVPRPVEERNARCTRNGVTVMAVGRLCVQKDPRFFAEAAEVGQRLMPGSRWCWLGDGDVMLRQHLERAGVHVSGWLDREDLLTRLSEASVYAHTASWEGAPLTLLEAVSAGLPVVARSIPALQSLRLPALIHSPEQMAHAVHALCEEDTARKWSDVLTENTGEHQAKMLRSLYGVAS